MCCGRSCGLQNVVCRVGEEEERNACVPVRVHVFVCVAGEKHVYSVKMPRNLFVDTITIAIG